MQSSSMDTQEHEIATSATPNPGDIAAPINLAKVADQARGSWQDNTGSLPFMALDLLSEEGQVPRRYRHDVESFAWSLICLCLATVEDGEGKSFTMDLHPLRRWFRDRESSRNAKIAFRWCDYDDSDIRAAHPNAKDLAHNLYSYWLYRFKVQFQKPTPRPGPEMMQLLGIKASDPRYVAPPPYQEPEDGRVFIDVVSVHEPPLDSASLQEVKKDLIRMAKKARDMYWSVQV